MISPGEDLARRETFQSGLSLLRRSLNARIFPQNGAARRNWDKLCIPHTYEYLIVDCTTATTTIGNILRSTPVASRRGKLYLKAVSAARPLFFLFPATNETEEEPALYSGERVGGGER